MAMEISKTKVCKTCGKEASIDSFYKNRRRCKNCFLETVKNKYLLRKSNNQTALIESLPNEVWKDVAGFEGLYRISNIGRIYSICGFGRGSDRVIGTQNKVTGYMNVRLSKNGFGKSIYIHRLVAITFIPNPENKPNVNHKNGVRNDNRVENLEWCTQKENIRHSYDVLGFKGAAYGKIDTNKSKPVLQIDPITNEIIAEYKSTASAARNVVPNRKYYSGIRMCAAGKLKTAYGFKWKFI